MDCPNPEANHGGANPTDNKGPANGKLFKAYNCQFPQFQQCTETFSDVVCDLANEWTGALSEAIKTICLFPFQAYRSTMAPTFRCSCNVALWTDLRNGQRR